MQDSIHRFIFEHHAIRGEMVRLDEASQQLLKRHNYPPFLANLLQQAALVSILLANSIKFDGKISLQLLTPGLLKMLIVQATSDLTFRGLIRFDDSLCDDELKFADLARSGQMCITIEPEKGERYQGVVPLDGSSLAECVENYFLRSEQLATRLWLFSNGEQAFGVMLQAMPGMEQPEVFEHLNILTNTLTAEECFSTPSETLLHRLFHQESVKHLGANLVGFACGCSEKKMLNSLSAMSDDEIHDIFDKEGQIEVTCEFCLNQFNFTELDIKKQASPPGNMTRH